MLGKRGRPQMASKGLKRPKRYEVNYLPDIPEGQSEDSLEAERKLLVEEMKKRNPNGTVIASKMDQTFPMRRREIVEAGPPVKTLNYYCECIFHTGPTLFSHYAFLLCVVGVCRVQ